MRYAKPENVVVTIALLVILLANLSCLCVSGYQAMDNWKNRSPMQLARIVLEAATVEGKIYAIGGIAHDGPTNVNEEYNPVTDTWSYKTPMPTSNYAFATAVYQNRIYCFGGKADGYWATNTSETYETSTDSWQMLSPMPTARMDLQAAVAENKIYLFGGRDSDDGGLDNITYFNVNEVYDPSANSWTTKAPMPQAGPCAASKTYGDKIYVLTLNSTLIYDTKTDTWSQGTTSPSTGIWLGAATTGDYAPIGIYIFGQNTVYRYNPRTDSWVDFPSNVTLNYYPAVAMLNDKFYVIGGFTLDYSQYNPASSYPLYFQPQEKYMCTNMEYMPVDYGTLDPSLTKPKVTILSPQNLIYNASSITLNFTVDKPTTLLWYSLDGKENATILGNTTLTSLPDGQHHIVVWANDTYGNMASSQTITFSVKTPTIDTVQAVTITGIATCVTVAAGAGYLIKIKKGK